MERPNRSDTLYIPVNIKTRTEFFSGYGMTELTYTAMATGISGLIAFFIYAATGKTMLCVLIVLITVAASVTMLSKDQSNQSVIDQLRFMARFMRTQRNFPYHYTDDWSDKI